MHGERKKECVHYVCACVQVYLVYVKCMYVRGPLW